MCFDHDEGSANDLIGEFYTSARPLMESANRQVKQSSSSKPFSLVVDITFIVVCYF